MKPKSHTPEQRSLTQAHDPQQGTALSPSGRPLWQQPVFIMGSAIGLGVIGYLSYRAYFTEKAQKGSLTDGSPESLAKLLHMAFENDTAFGLGTDVKAIRSVMVGIKSKAEMLKVYKAYQQAYHENLYKRMEEELQSTEYNEMIQILAGKPEKTGGPVSSVIYSAWARRLYAAFNKTYGLLPGTDEEAVRAVGLELPNQKAFVYTGAVYQKLFGKPLMQELKAELQGEEYYAFMQHILSKPRQ